MTINVGAESTDWAGDRGPHFAAAQEAYDAAKAEQRHLIDNPDKTLPVIDYLEKLKAAKDKVSAAHRALIAAWSAA